MNEGTLRSNWKSETGEDTQDHISTPLDMTKELFDMTKESLDMTKELFDMTKEVLDMTKEQDNSIISENIYES